MIELVATVSALNSDSIEVVWLSVKVALAAVAVGAVPGIALAYLLSRRRLPAWLQFATEVVVNLPLVMPPVVTGYFLLVLLGKNGWIGKWLLQTTGIEFVFDWKGAVMAAAVISFPLFLRSCRLGFNSIDPRLKDAADTLGIPAWKTFFKIELPLAIHGIYSGALLAFARSLGEFGATVMIAGSIPGETRTLSLEIFQQFQSPQGLANAKGLLVISVLIAAGAIIVSEWLEKRHSNR